MNRSRVFGSILPGVIVIAAGLLAPALAADAPAPTPAPASAATPPPAATGPEVKPAAPGVFASKKVDATRYHLSVTGHAFTSREAIEKYLAYRAAQLTMDQKFSWFSFVEHRAKGDNAPVPKRDPSGMRYSFRMEFFRPVWRYKTGASPNWKTWSPFAGAAFWADGLDAKSVTAFEVSADIALRKGMVEDDNPLAFDASAVSDFLINQVEPPQ